MQNVNVSQWSSTYQLLATSYTVCIPWVLGTSTREPVHTYELIICVRVQYPPKVQIHDTCMHIYVYTYACIHVHVYTRHNCSQGPYTLG